MQSWLVPFHSENVGFYPLFMEGAEIKAGMHWVSVPWRQALGPAWLQDTVWRTHVEAGRGKASEVKGGLDA